MITNKIKTRYWFLFIVLAVGFILCLIGLALSKGEQNVVAEEFRSVFYLSTFGTIILGISLIIGIAYLRR
jgi:hypothetical protein